MALRNILRDGDPSLLKKSRVVTDFNERLHILLDDMRETLTEANGLGLAAPQVGVLRRAVLIVDTGSVPEDEEIETDNESSIDTADCSDAELSAADGESEETDEHEITIIELVNPELIYQQGEQKGSEGCLSLPGRYGLVTRPQTVKVKAQDRFGEEFELEASGLTARAVCHEINHLDGIIFTTLAERMLTQEEMDEMRKADEETE